jgi:hypothetical protein
MEVSRCSYDNDELRAQEELADAVQQFISRSHESRRYTNGDKKPDDDELAERKARVFSSITKVLREDSDY